MDYAGRAQALKKNHPHRNCQRAPETLLEGSKGFQGLGMCWNVLECFGISHFITSLSHLIFPCVLFYTVFFPVCTALPPG